jgi:DNA-3-methyladenine glycosylase
LSRSLRLHPPLDLMLHLQTVDKCILTQPREFYSRPTLAVARDLLGAPLHRRLENGDERVGRILEVEAYTQDDPASHAFRGKTERCKIMFGPAGYAYVYFIYGMYWCLNVVTEPEGIPGAVLIRAVETANGDGPGKLCRAWEIDKRQYGDDMCDPNSGVWIGRSQPLPDADIEVSTRIGLKVAQDRIWRFFVKDHQGVSGTRKRSTMRSALGSAASAKCLTILVLLMAQLCLGTKLLAASPARLRNLTNTATVITFPKDKSIGNLSMGRVNTDGYLQDTKHVADAIGTVSVVVPQNSWLLFEPNGKVVADPKILESVTAPGVSTVKLSFLSCDDAEDGKCDQAMSHLGRFTGLIRLDLDRSDATDKGLLLLPPLKNLADISCTGTFIKGSSFKTLKRFPGLSKLKLQGCSLNLTDLNDLVWVPQLRVLNLNATHMTSEGLKNVSKLVSLKVLCVRNNRNLDDSGLKYLLPLKHLESIDLSSTKVTSNGIAVLRQLPLKVLVCPDWSAADMNNARKLLPKTVLRVNQSKKVDDGVAEIFAPLPK